jgi:hypothetical protein
MTGSLSVSPGVWLVTHKRNSGDSYVPRDEIVDEALAFGWVDSLPHTLDERRCQLLLTPRKPTSNETSRLAGTEHPWRPPRPSDLQIARCASPSRVRVRRPFFSPIRNRHVPGSRSGLAEYPDVVAQDRGRPALAVDAVDGDLRAADHDVLVDV